MLFYPGLFGRRRKNERARERDEAGTRRERRRGGGRDPGNERLAARVRLIDEFRLEIFAVPYALNRRTRVRRNSRRSKIPITGNKNE